MTFPDENLSVILSREELSFLLFLVKANFIPGMDSDPAGEPTPEQQKRSLAEAERALRARDLAKVDENGDVAVREKLLLMAGVCAYSELTITLHQFPSQRQPRRVFWHIQSGVIVMHTRPEPPLHGLEFLLGRDGLHNNILQACQMINQPALSLPAINATNALVKTVREAAPQNVKQAVRLLVEQDVAEQSAQEICGVLSSEYIVSALHLAANQNGNTIRQSMTLLTGTSSSWLMTNTGEDHVILETIDLPDFLTRLESWTGFATWIESPAQY